MLIQDNGKHKMLRLEQLIMMLSVTFILAGCEQFVGRPIVSQEIDLGRAVILVNQSKAVHARAADMLADEIEKRSGIRLAIVESIPKPPVPVIELDTIESLPATQKATAVPSKAEGYAIWVDAGHTSRRTVFLVGRDDRGVLFAAARLIRVLSFRPGGISVRSDVRIATAPQYPIRGHQFGYRNLNNTSDAWDLAAYEQYIRDLV